MAKQTQVIYTDDLTGETIDGNGGSVTFAFDGQNYTIDLTDKNKAEFQKVIQPYVDKATRVGKTGKKQITTNAAEIRAWAIEEGLLPEGSRGRIPNEVALAYSQRKK